MNEAEKYAVQWDISAQYFYEKSYYSWMSEKLNGYKIVLEIGCGTGYSTLALAEKGFKVLAVDKNGKQPIETWQKYMENGEYLRSIESGEEENYSFIDGNKNNDKKKNGRVSVLKKLRQKQAEVAKRSGKPAQQMEAAADMERRRK